MAGRGARGPLTTTAPAPRRRRLLLGLTLALPWALLALAELGLRLGGYGDAYPLFVPYPERPEFLMPNERVGRRWFRGVFAPSTQLGFFRAVKAPGTIRVVFQGESSAAGFPYGHGGAPSRMLEQRLQATFPDRPVEVINTALTAVSSYVLLDQADEIVAQRPDAVLIYTGHNEYYGVFGAASTRALGGSRLVVRAYLALRRLRTVQLLENALDAAGATPGPPDPAGAPGTVMELMAGDQLVPLGSGAFDRGVAQFRANLDALLARYRAAGIPVYVGTLASNERDQAPLVRVMPDVRIGDAPARFTEARRRDLAGDTAAARRLYRTAKEEDALRFRAPEAMNAVVREVAARRGATVVETQRAIERASPAGIPGRTLFLEHLHPNVDGYFVIADAFYEALRARGAFGGAWPAAVPAEAARRAVPVTALDSLAALYRTDRLTSGWPFRPRGVRVAAIVDTLRPRDSLETLAQQLVNGRVSWAEATDRARAHAERSGNADAAIRAALALGTEYRYSAQPYLDAARVALAHGRADDAARFAELARSRGAPEDAPELAASRGATAAARMLPRLVEQRAKAPRDTMVLFRLATAYALTAQYDSARATLRALLGVAPSHAHGRALLERLPR